MFNLIKNTFKRRRIHVLQHEVVRTGWVLVESVLASLDAATAKKVVEAGIDGRQPLHERRRLAKHHKCVDGR